MDSDLFTHYSPLQAGKTTQGPLMGKSIAVQPGVSVHGWPTEAGTPALEGFVALENATVVDRLLQAGATLVGATRMSELGFGMKGETTALAVSRGLADLALMTDRMGEARVAAAGIGVFGFKPTQGIVSRFGWIGLAPSMECCGLLSGSPEWISDVMGKVTGEDGKDFSLQISGLPDFRPGVGEAQLIRKVGVLKELFAVLSETETRAFRKGLDRLAALGFDILELSLADHALFSTVHRIIGSVEASSSCGKYDGVRYGHRTKAAVKNWNEMYLRSRSESFGMPLKTYLFQGAYFQFENYGAFEDAARIRAKLVRDTAGLLTRADVLASPTRREATCTGADETIGSIYAECALTLPANVTGLPAIQIPGFVTDGDKDFGLQVTGSRLNDARLLSLAVRLSESATGH